MTQNRVRHARRLDHSPNVVDAHDVRPGQQSGRYGRRSAKCSFTSRPIESRADESLPRSTRDERASQDMQTREPGEQFIVFLTVLTESEARIEQNFSRMQASFDRFLLKALQA